MFTGIITDLGRVRDVRPERDTRIEIGTSFDDASIPIGASIACSGVCLTVIDKGPGWFAAQVSAETLSCTTLGDWRPGTLVNLERALKLGDELGGHFVSGHVDESAEWPRSHQREPLALRLRGATVARPLHCLENVPSMASR